MRATEMNDWVGGADPQRVGEFNAALVLKYLNVRYETQILDFGAGIGRVAAGILHKRPLVKALIGIDIVPRFVDFCRANISPKFPNAKFELLVDQNLHYERFKTEAHAKSRDALAALYGGQIDCGYAISVFTHVDVEDFVETLRFVRTLLVPGGCFVFTAFALTPFSRNLIAKGRPQFSVDTGKFERDGTVFVANPADRLSFIAYDMALLDRMVWEAGLVPLAVEYGCWCGGDNNRMLQDLIVCRKPFETELL